MHRLSKVKIEWSSKFAYAIGLIATDGCLSGDRRHIDFTSKDEELVLKFRECLGINNKVGIKQRGKDKYKMNTCFRVQFCDTNFYEFLISIGLSPRKSKTINSLKIPNRFFKDFLRGCIDGDGSIGSFKHPESKHPQLRIRLVSASKNFLEWIKSQIERALKIKTGWIYNAGDVYALCYAKADSVKLISFLYGDRDCVCLSRKFDMAKKFNGRVAELV